MTEDFLQYIWQHQLLINGLTTIDGQPVVVLRAGERNVDSGPDFFNARLKIGDVEWVGNVEIHIHSSDWQKHHHNKNNAYNNVVLHVVYENDGKVFLQNGKTPYTVELKCFLHPAIVANYDVLNGHSDDKAIPCGKRINDIPSFIVSSYLERLTVERIENKTDAVNRLLHESCGGWEQTCYWLIAHYFGGTVNALPFELLAKSTDQRLLARWKDNPQRIEAILAGQSGMLEGYFEDEYPRSLQSDYEAIRYGLGLKPIDSYLWRYFCLRPSAFPAIRISQFARLISESSNLFATMLQITDVKQIERLFNQQAASYWDNHYHFDKTSNKTMHKHIGKMQADNLIINAWVPLLFAYGNAHAQQQYKDQAVDLLVQLPAENNAIIRRWNEVGINADNAAESQALLQLYNNYCRNRHCLDCRLGYEVIKKVR